MTPTDNRYIPIIVSLRGLSSLSICLFHFVYSPDNFIENDQLKDFFRYGQKGVEVFFIISSVVITSFLLKSNYSLKNLPVFLTKRIVRVEPPYLFAILLGVLYLIIRNYIPSSKPIDLTPSIDDLLLHLAYLVPFFENAKWVNPIFWTLAIEFQFYIFISVFIPLGISQKWFSRLLFYVIIITTSFFLTDKFLFPFWSNYFASGIIYMMYRYSKISKKEFVVISIICFTSIYFNHGLTNLIISFSTLLAIHFFSNWKSRLTDFLGKISYSLYLLHNIIGAAFLNFMIPRVDNNYEKFAIISISLIISISSAYLFWRIVETPFHKIEKKIKWS